MATFDLSGKTALVTGGARGIGFATAQKLVGRGANVAIVDLDRESVERSAGQIHDTKAIGIAADVTDRGSMQRAVAETVDKFGALDVVVANAGIAPTGATVRAAATEAFERVIDVNLMGVYRTVDVALPEIVRNRGHVVVIASIYAFTNGAGAASYAMSKAGVEQFGRALRVELAPHGASASVAYFGFIDTEMVHRAIDADPLAPTMMATVPRPLRKRLPPSAAGEGIVRGIERRQARIIRPRRWAVLSVLRGIVNPLTDKQALRDKRLREAVDQLDARADQEQTTTA